MYYAGFIHCMHIHFAPDAPIPRLQSISGIVLKSALFAIKELLSGYNEAIVEIRWFHCFLFKCGSF